MPQRSPKDDSTEQVPAERGETILVVEDDDDVRAYLVETLHDLDYDCFVLTIPLPRSNSFNKTRGLICC